MNFPLVINFQGGAKGADCINHTLGRLTVLLHLADVCCQC